MPDKSNIKKEVVGLAYSLRGGRAGRGTGECEAAVLLLLESGSTERHILAPHPLSHFYQPGAHTWGVSSLLSYTSLEVSSERHLREVFHGDWKSPSVHCEDSVS